MSHDDLHRLWGESERERRGWVRGGRDSFRISKCLLGSACAFSVGGSKGVGGGGGGGVGGGGGEGGGGGRKRRSGVDNIRMEKKMKGRERVI